VQAGVTARRRGNPVRLLHGVYPEQNKEILPLHFIQGQNDKKRRVRNDPLFNVNLFKPFTIAVFDDKIFLKNVDFGLKFNYTQFRMDHGQFFQVRSRENK
jgi:hypothetical protein